MLLVVHSSLCTHAEINYVVSVTKFCPNGTHKSSRIQIVDLHVDQLDMDSVLATDRKCPSNRQKKARKSGAKKARKKTRGAKIILARVRHNELLSTFIFSYIDL